MTDVILAAFVLGPAVIAYFLKSNAALSFLALCAGFVVLSFAGSDLQDLTGQLSFSIDHGILNLVLLLLPLVFTLFFTKGSLKGGMGVVVHVVIALCAGGLLALIGIPLLSDLVSIKIADSELWSNLQNIQAQVIGTGVFLSLVVVWAKSLKKKSKLRDKKHK